MKLQPKYYQDLIKIALAEDLGMGDITSKALFSKAGPKIKAQLVAKGPLLVAGLEVAQEVFRKVSPKTKFFLRKDEGDHCNDGEILAVIEGAAQNILSAERVALNFVQQLSGVATLTQKFVEAIRGNSTKILDTRKTIPGWRMLQKYAVKIGGGVNHRFGLYDAYLIKDNHLALFGSLTEAIETVKKHNRKKFKIEVEIDTLSQLTEVLACKPDWILLDNMPLEDMRLAVLETKGRTILEASGNINLNNVRAVAQTGVDYISVGTLTHSAPAVDISLEIV